MSSVYQPKRKEMANVKICSTEHFSKNRDSLKFVGKIRRNLSNFVLTKGGNKKLSSFLDDTFSLPKRAKNDLVRFFEDKNNDGKNVAYLVVPKNKLKMSTKKR